MGCPLGVGRAPLVRHQEKSQTGLWSARRIRQIFEDGRRSGASGGTYRCQVWEEGDLTPCLAARLNPGRSGSTREDGFLPTEDARPLDVERRCRRIRERLVLSPREPDLRPAAEL